MSFNLELCDECGKPATTAIHYEERTERYCEKHWVESRGELVRQVVCADCEEQVAPLSDASSKRISA